MVVGFNLLFDLSRLAVKWAEDKKGDWSLALSSRWKNPKTGRVVPNPKRPRIVVDAQNSKMSFIRLGSILHPEEWPHEGLRLRRHSRIRSKCKTDLSFTGQQPLDRSSKLTTNLQEDCAAHLSFTVLYHRQVSLCDSNSLRQVCLAHIESAQFSDSPTNGFPVNLKGLRSRSFA